MDRIFILDELVVEQSRLAELRQAFLDRYVPSARARGMTLDGAWQTPPIAIPGRRVTLYFLWSVENLGGFWTMRLGGGFSNPDAEPAWEGEDKEQWWLHVDGIAVSRRRQIMTGVEGTVTHV